MLGHDGQVVSLIQVKNGREYGTTRFGSGQMGRGNETDRNRIQIPEENAGRGARAS
jgi:hypothetical protein